MAARSGEGVPRGASASSSPTGIRTNRLAARASALARRPVVRIGLAVLAILAAVAVTAVAVDRALRANGVERSDARVAAALQASDAALRARVSSAQDEAERLASSRAVQAALAAHDQTRLARIVGRASDPVVITPGRGAPVGRPRSDAIRRSATIGPAGSSLGQVTVFVPLDLGLLEDIERPEDVRAGIVLGLARGGALVVGPGTVRDASVSVRSGPPTGTSIDGAPYRAAAVEVVGGPTPTQLVALVPKPLVDSTASRRRRILVAAVASLATALLVLLTVSQIVRSRRASRDAGRDRRRSLGPRAAPVGRAGGRDALALVGDALAATHDPEALLPVILGAAIEATGATGGRLVAGTRELAIRGESADPAKSLVVPLGNGDDSGSLVLFPPSDGFAPESRELARWLATQASIALENARLHGLVKAQAVTDELTGLANRRRFMEVLELELKRSDRFTSPLALVLADLDDFKLVNDRFGHQTGDDVLRALSRVFRASLRDVDLPARLGGEEFAVLLPETDALGAEGLAERLRAELAALELQGPGPEPLRVTASFGVAVYPEAASGDDLLSFADAALYAAKATGKNRVVLHFETAS